MIVLIVAAARILRLNDYHLHTDELWSIWQGFGSFTDTLRWTPYDWPPLYYLVLDAWVELAGLQPVALRMASVFSFLIGAACFYQVLRKHISELSAVIGILVFGGIAYSIFLSIELRGYALMLGMIPLAWWIAQRMMQKPKWYFVTPFIVCTTASIYSTYISIFPVLLLYLYIVLFSPTSLKNSLRLWLSIILSTFLLLLPLILHITPLVFSRVEVTTKITLPPIHEAHANWFAHTLNRGIWLLLFLIILAAMVSIRKRRINRLELLFWLWGIIALPTLYVLNPILAFFGPKYSSWVFFGIAGFVAINVEAIDARFRRVILGIVIVLFSIPMQFSIYYDPTDDYILAQHLAENFTWLRDELQANDHVLFADDEECTFHVNNWNLPLAIIKPDGLNIVDSVKNHPRIWFVTADGSPDSPHWETLRRDYVERHFVGPPGCLFRLYERPPDAEGVLFANGMRFHGAQFLQDGEALPPGFIPQLHEGEGFQVRLWWKVEERLPQDYSVGTFLFDAAGRVIEEVHGPPDPSYPEGAPWETSRWQVGQIYYEDRQFELPYPLERQRLELRMAVYHWEQPAQRFEAEGVDAIGMMPILSLNVFSW